MKENLSRFRKAQETDYDTALSEIRSGRKRSHWMWYIFPQIAGLGHSGISGYYAICDLEEAEAYIRDPVLGRRLVEICEALLDLEMSDPHQVFGSPDDLKLCSSMTLFEKAAPEQLVFGKVLEKYYGGRRDPRTLEILKRQQAH